MNQGSASRLLFCRVRGYITQDQDLGILLVSGFRAQGVQGLRVQSPKVSLFRMLFSRSEKGYIDKLYPCDGDVCRFCSSAGFRMSAWAKSFQQQEDQWRDCAHSRPRRKNLGLSVWMELVSNEVPAGSKQLVIKATIIMISQISAFYKWLFVEVQSRSTSSGLRCRCYG